MYPKDVSLPPPATQAGPKRRNAGDVCCCLSLWLCVIVTTLLVLFCILVVAFFIVLHPELPGYDIQNFQLTGLPNRTLSSADPDPSTILSFQIVNRNPNKNADIYYDQSFVSVVSKKDGAAIAAATIPEYSQSDETTTTLEEDFKISKESSNLLLSNDLNLSDWAVSVKLDVKARLKAGLLETGKFKVKARCQLRVDVLSSPQKINFRQCKVDD